MQIKKKSYSIIIITDSFINFGDSLNYINTIYSNLTKINTNEFTMEKKIIEENLGLQL